MSTTVLRLHTAHEPSREGARLRARAAFARILDGFSTYLARRRQRDALAGLADDKHLLADIGLTREQALREAGKPFWQ